LGGGNARGPRSGPTAFSPPNKHRSVSRVFWMGPGGLRGGGWHVLMQPSPRNLPVPAETRFQSGDGLRGFGWGRVDCRGGGWHVLMRPSPRQSTGPSRNHVAVVGAAAGMYSCGHRHDNAGLCDNDSALPMRPAAAAGHLAHKPTVDRRGLSRPRRRAVAPVFPAWESFFRR
jgi:hypothetical protein